MKFNWSYSWIILFIISIILNIISISITSQEDLLHSHNINLVNSLQFINTFISLIGLCIFIYWLIKFNNTKILMYLWIIMLIITISLGLIFINGGLKPSIIADFSIISSQTTIIFLGALITFLIKKR